MLDSIDLTYSLAKRAFKPVRREMLQRIFELSEMIYERKRPVIVVFEGWDAAGKGTTIRALTQQLDARGYKVLATQAARTHEKMKPWLWRFWMNIPRYGQIAIFDRSWYGRVLVERVEGLTPIPEWIAAYEEINQFERTLADDGAVFIKFWLHISREEQLRRFLELSAHPETAWQVAAEDWEHHRKYDEYLAAVRDMLASTNTAFAPWVAVSATDRDFRLYTVFHTIISRLEDALGLEPTAWPKPADLEAEEVKADRKKTKRSEPNDAPDAAGAADKKRKKQAKKATKAESAGKKKKKGQQQADSAPAEGTAVPAPELDADAATQLDAAAARLPDPAAPEQSKDADTAPVTAPAAKRGRPRKNAAKSPAQAAPDPDQTA